MLGQNIKDIRFYCKYLKAIDNQVNVTLRYLNKFSSCKNPHQSFYALFSGNKNCIFRNGDCWKIWPLPLRTIINILKDFSDYRRKKSSSQWFEIHTSQYKLRFVFSSYALFANQFQQYFVFAKKRKIYSLSQCPGIPCYLFISKLNWDPNLLQHFCM